MPEAVWLTRVTTFYLHDFRWVFSGLNLVHPAYLKCHNTFMFQNTFIFNWHQDDDKLRRDCLSFGESLVSSLLNGDRDINEHTNTSCTLTVNMQRIWLCLLCAQGISVFSSLQLYNEICKKKNNNNNNKNNTSIAVSYTVGPYWNTWDFERFRSSAFSPFSPLI